MKPFAFVLACVLGAVPAASQRHKLSTVNAASEEGKILQEISNEQDSAKKIALMQQFLTAHDKHEAATWVTYQLQQEYLKGKDFDNTIATGEKLLAADPGDLDAAYANLKAAEGKKDSDGVLKWGTATSEIARKAQQSPKGADESDED